MKSGKSGERLKPEVLSSEIRVDGEGNEYVAYLHVTTKGEKKYTAFSRFARFAYLDEEVRKHYKGNHLYSNIPKFPKKQNKFMVDHLSEEFIKERTEALNEYIQNLGKLPGVETCPVYIDFLTNESHTFGMEKDFQYIHMGYLYKQGIHNPTWKKRWFALTPNGILFYFAGHKDDKPKGQIEITSKTVVRKIDSTIPRPNCLQLITPSRVYYIAADDAVSLDTWVEVLKNENNVKDVTDDLSSGSSGTEQKQDLLIQRHFAKE